MERGNLHAFFQQRLLSAQLLDKQTWRTLLPWLASQVFGPHCREGVLFRGLTRSMIYLPLSKVALKSFVTSL
jgi:hypothetical protein